ncbi:MAG: UDP-N-acetylglucosamine--N-acetylmuramyl-(pentapeptide) pyrophosphoryl-undecaprenol N-acetylglucosamine transferase [Candidatus Moraniibacteriota bacterium]
MKKRIVLSGGFSGGHLFPLVTVARYLKENYGEDNFEFLFLGPKGRLESELMKKNNIEQKDILCGKLRRYFSFRYLVDFLKLPVGFFQSLWHLFVFMPEVVFAKGGFASVPVVLAAKAYRIPVIIHESDAIPGIANKFLGSISNLITVNFKKAAEYFPKDKVFEAGLPVKKDALEGDGQKARELLGLKKEVKPVVLFLGGSQGAFAVNEAVINSIEELTHYFQVVHQTGEAHYEAVKKTVERKGYKIGYSDYHPFGFLGEKLKDVIDLADVVVSRAGATTIAELAANGKPVLLVPISRSANDHQRINAYELAKNKAALVLEEGNFSKNMLMHNLKRIAFEDKVRIDLSRNIKGFYYPDATSKIADKIMLLADK